MINSNNNSKDELLKIIEQLKFENERLIENYTVITEKMLDGFQTIDHNGRVLTVSESYCSLIGYSKEELLKMNINDIDVFEKHNDTKQKLKMIKNGELKRFETKHKTKSGKILDIEVNVTYSKKNEIFYIFFKNITDLKKLNKQLNASEEKYTSLFNEMLNGIAVHRIICDEKGNPVDYIFLDINPAFEKLTGLKKKNILNKRVLEVMPNIEKIWIEKYGEVALQGKTLHFENHSQELNKYYEVTAFSIKKGEFIVIFSDITDRKISEIKLAESEKRYRTLTDNITDAIFLIDNNDKIVDVNSAACKSLGYNRKKLLEMSISDINPTFMTGNHPDTILKKCREQYPIILNTKHQHKNGNVFPVEITVSPVDENLTVRCVRDISERIKTEQELYMFKIVADRVSVSIFWLTPDGKFLYVNQAAANSLGYIPDDLVDKYVWDIDPNYPKELRQNQWEKIKKVKILNFETYHKDINNNIRFVEVYSTYVNVDGNEYEFAFALDVTLKKEMQKKISEINTLNRQIINSMQDGLIVYDKDLRYKVWNKYMEQLTDIKSENILGKRPYEEFEFLKDVKMEQRLKSILKGKKQKPIEISFYLPKLNKRGWTLHTSSPLKDDNGKITGIISIVRDITELKKLQEQLIHSEKLSAVGQLAAGIAHEFNNILAVNSINSQLIRLEIENINDDLESVEKNIKDSTENINIAVNRGKTIVADMMSFAVPNKPKKTFCNIEEVIEDVLKLQRNQLNLEHIVIKKNYDSNKKVFIDKNQFGQVFLNIIINARHAIRPLKKGTITIIIKDKNDFVKIEISDTGKGMDKKTKSKIFTPFFSTKGAYSKDSLGIKGTGLGLVVSYSIIKNHNGTINVESEEGRGTTFEIKIPFANENKIIYEVKKNMTNIVYKNKKLLIIDDEESFVKPIVRLLTKYGYNNILTATSGVAGLKIAATEKIDLVLVDLLLPDMNGEEIFKEIKKINKDIPIIFISGQVNLDKEKLKKMGAAGFIQKPFTIEELEELISDLSAD